MRILCGIASLVFVLLTLGWTNNLWWLVDPPSMIIAWSPIPFILMSKYGVNALTFFKQDEPLRSKIAKDGGHLALLCGFFGSLIGLVSMLGNLSDQAAVGPAMAIAFLSTLYGLLLYLFLFFPFQYKEEK